MSCDAESYTAVNFHSGNRAFDYRAWKQDGKLSTWQREFRERLQETLGLSSILETYRELPLSACNLEVVKFATYRREKWTICSEPGVKIPFYLFLPNSTRPVPLLMILHGHNKTGKEVFVSTLNEQPEVAVVERALNEGYAVMTPDVRGRSRPRAGICGKPPIACWRACRPSPNSVPRSAAASSGSRGTSRQSERGSLSGKSEGGIAEPGCGNSDRRKKKNAPVAGDCGAGASRCVPPPHGGGGRQAVRDWRRRS